MHLHAWAKIRKVKLEKMLIDILSDLPIVSRKVGQKARPPALSFSRRPRVHSDALAPAIRSHRR